MNRLWKLNNSFHITMTLRGLSVVYKRMRIRESVRTLSTGKVSMDYLVKKCMGTVAGISNRKNQRCTVSDENKAVLKCQSVCTIKCCELIGMLQFLLFTGSVLN